MQHLPSLPKIEIIKVGKAFKVCWDYEEAPESAALTREGEYLRANIKGALDALDVRRTKISYTSGMTGTVNKLDEAVVHKLADPLENLLHAMVSAEQKRLMAVAKLPPHLNPATAY